MNLAQMLRQTMGNPERGEPVFTLLAADDDQQSVVDLRSQVDSFLHGDDSEAYGSVSAVGSDPGINGAGATFYSVGGAPKSSVDGFGGVLGKLLSGPEPTTVAAIAQVASPVVSAAIAAIATWLASRSGRKVKARIGNDVEIEASNQEEFMKMLTAVQEFQEKRSSTDILGQLMK